MKTIHIKGVYFVIKHIKSFQVLTLPFAKRDDIGEIIKEEGTIKRFYNLHIDCGQMQYNLDYETHEDAFQDQQRLLAAF